MSRARVAALAAAVAMLVPAAAVAVAAPPKRSPTVGVGGAPLMTIDKES